MDKKTTYMKATSDTRWSNHLFTDLWRINMYKCPKCYKGFTRSDNMSRHWKQMHETINGRYPALSLQEESSSPSPRDEEVLSHRQTTTLYHPFTMMISGPTCKLILSLFDQM